MIPRLTAVHFHRFMGSGRTSPALCGCEDVDGKFVGDYVVKLRGGVERGDEGMQCELMASGLASHFGIIAPEPAFVTIEQDLAELIAENQPSRAGRIRGSVGLNFASRQLNDVSIWPVDRNLSDGVWQSAVNVYAFDALIQNPDRRAGNPNLFARGEDLIVYDHEMAFSFLLDILPSNTPWVLANGHRYLEDHVFYRKLRTKPIDLNKFTTTLRGLAATGLSDILASAPAEWNNGCLQKIDGHLQAVSAHAEDFAEEVIRRLA
jgi:hypothetical protein